MSDQHRKDPALRGPAAFVFAATRPVAVTMMVLAAVVFGFVGFAQLPVDLLPDIAYPTLTIRTEYPGTSPEDVEERISEPIQESVGVVPGVRRAVSISRPGVSDVLLEFAWGTEMTFAISDVRDRLERVFLPPDAERPLVLRYDPSLDPVLTIGLSGDLDATALRRIAEDELERELAKVEGVAAVKLRGGEEEEIRIAIDEGALAVLKLDVGVIAARLKDENVNAAAGSIEEAKTAFLVRTLGEFRNLDEIRQVVIERRNGAPIRLEDVATVERIPRDREVISRIDGKPCVLIDVFKEAGANIVSLAERVRTRLQGTPAQQAYVAKLGPDLAMPDPVIPKKPDGSEPTTKDVERAIARARAAYGRNTDYLSFQVKRAGASAVLLQDQSTFIEQSIDDVQSSAVLGGLFAVLVILLFLRRASTTAILALSIPISLIAAFAPMYLSEITLNVMSLGGLALGVGMLVDNSIVVLESITRAREEGLPPKQAAVQGVSRVASAVTASTLTTVAVFFPIVFVEGLAGQLFRDQSLTVVYSLLISLGVALLVIPMLASRTGGSSTVPVTPPRLPPKSGVSKLVSAVWSVLGFAVGAVFALLLMPFWVFALVLSDSPIQDYAKSVFGGPTQRGGAAVVFAVLKVLGMLAWVLRLLTSPIAYLFDRFYQTVESAYPRLLGGALRIRALVILIALGLLAFAGTRAGRLGAEILPDVASGELIVETYLPRDATVERTDAVNRPIEAAIREMPGVTETFLAVGVDKEELNSAEEGEHSARILVRLDRDEDIAVAEGRLRRKIQEVLRRTPEVESFRFSRPSVLAFDTPLVVELVGDDLTDLRQSSLRVQEMLRSVDGLEDVRATLQRGNPELVIRLDREEMSALGLDTGTVTDILASKIQGDVPTRFTERDRKIDMRVAIAREELDRLSRLLEINVNPSGDPRIPLSAVAEIDNLEGPSEIRRLGNSRGAEVQATVRGFALSSAQERVLDELDGMRFPDGIEARLGGQKEEFDRSQQSVLLALILAIFLVYVVMASQFESFVQPFVILLSLPLALVGVVFTLEATGTALSVLVMLGCIVLAGIVVNNAIILIDQINQLRRRDGLAKNDAILQGARSRLRPVLMTTATTVLGLLPLTGWIGQGDGVELRAPLAITVVAGLTVSTVLTLLVIPVVYSLADRKA